MISMDNVATALIQQLLHRQQRRHHEITPAYMTNTSNEIITVSHVTNAITKYMYMHCCMRSWLF